MTKYYYKNEEISHLDFIRIMRENGLASGYKISHYQHLLNMAEKGNKKAKTILTNLRIEK